MFNRTSFGTALAALGVLAGATFGAEKSVKPEKGPKAAELFNTTNVWTAHFKFTPEAWEGLEPKSGGGFFGGPGGGRGPGGPGFGPSMFIAPAFLKDGDSDGNGQISKSEFRALGEKWFSTWDKEKAGKISDEQLRDGLNATLMPGGPGMGGPNFRRGLQGAEGKRNGVAAMTGIEFEYVKADLDFAGKKLTNIAVRFKGNGTFMASRATDKKSLKIDLNDFAKGQKLAGRNKINLHNSITDPSWMNEVLSYRLFRDAGVPAPRTAYVKVSATVSGKFDYKYLGLYSTVENVDEDFAEANFGSDKGAIFKPVTPDLFNYLGEDWAAYNQTYDPKGKVTPEQKRRMIELCKFISKSSDEEFKKRLGEFIDLDEFANYMSVLMFLVDMDGILGPGQNFYLHLDSKSGKIAFIPWDMDHSFGQFPMRGTQEQRENLSLDKPWQGENRFLARVYKNEEFLKRYRARLAEYSKTLFKPERFEQQVDELAALLRPAVQMEGADKLARFEAVVAGKSVAPEMFGPGPRPGGEGGPGPRGVGPGPGGPPMGGFFGPTKPIKPFVKIRAKSIADQLAGKPGQVMEEFGGFGPPGGGPGGRGGPRGFGPGMFLGGAFMGALDQDKDNELTKGEVTAGFAKWFEQWNSSNSGSLTQEELRAGIDKDLAPPNPFGGPGFRPPGPPR